MSLTKTGMIKNASTARSKFHYISRAQQFKTYQEHDLETIEFMHSGNMPTCDSPDLFWQAADLNERRNGRVCSSFVVALPKELTVEQRIELAEQFIDEFAMRYRFPFSCAIHNHAGAFSGQEQPHLHFMYSERHVDGHERDLAQFFKRYNTKEPEKGGAKKLTADKLGLRKAQITFFRQKAEKLINHALKTYAPTKKVEIKGVSLEVPNVVSCLSNKDYKEKYGIELQDVPIMSKRIRFAKKAKDEALFAQQQEILAEIQRIRKENEYKLYKAYYDAELRRIWQLEQAKKEKDRGYDGPGF